MTMQPLPAYWRRLPRETPEYELFKVWRYTRKSDLVFVVRHFREIDVVVAQTLVRNPLIQNTDDCINRFRQKYGVTRAQNPSKHLFEGLWVNAGIREVGYDRAALSKYLRDNLPQPLWPRTLDFMRARLYAHNREQATIRDRAVARKKIRFARAIYDAASYAVKPVLWGFAKRVDTFLDEILS